MWIFEYIICILQKHEIDYWQNVIIQIENSWKSKNRMIQNNQIWNWPSNLFRKTANSTTNSYSNKPTNTTNLWHGWFGLQLNDSSRMTEASNRLMKRIPMMISFGIPSGNNRFEIKFIINVLIVFNGNILRYFVKLGLKGDIGRYGDRWIFAR